jgi:hypothetical protein
MNISNIPNALTPIVANFSAVLIVFSQNQYFFELIGLSFSY